VVLDRVSPGRARRSCRTLDHVEDTNLYRLDVGAGSPYQRAVQWVVELFWQDGRKGKPEVPYLSHLFAVAALVMQDGGSEAEVIAALLHDTIEDKHVPKRRIAEKIGGSLGAEVARIVFACSDGVDESGRDVDEQGNVVAKRGPETWRPRKEQYLAHLGSADTFTLRVSVADKLDNARDIVADLHRDRATAMRVFNAPPSDQLWWYDALRNTFNKQLPESSLTQRFASAVKELSLLIDVEEATLAWECAHPGQGGGRSTPFERLE
jgi:(p)ppGpp synthase/HD superfamily hydrolase